MPSCRNDRLVGDPGPFGEKKQTRNRNKNRRKEAHRQKAKKTGKTQRTGQRIAAGADRTARPCDAFCAKRNKQASRLQREPTETRVCVVLFAHELDIVAQQLAAAAPGGAQKDARRHAACSWHRLKRSVFWGSVIISFRCNGGARLCHALSTARNKQASRLTRTSVWCSLRMSWP